MPPWTELMSSFGFPVVCVVAMSLALWRVVIWIGRKLLEPAVKALIELIVQLQKSLKAHDEMLESQGRMLGRLTKMMEQLTFQQQQIAGILSGSDKTKLALTKPVES